MDDPTDAGLLIQDLIYVGLDALRAASPLDLCAYLHVREGEGPQLYLSTPDLASVDPSEAFSLFSSLRDLLEHEHHGDDTVLLGGFFAAAVSTAGPSTRGLFVIGRREAALEPEQRDGLIRLAGRLGSLVHRLEGAPRTGAPVSGASPIPVRVAVETAGALARAEITASFGDEVRAGTAEASTPARAVASAVIDVVDGSLKLIEAGEGEIGGERAVMVLLADQWDRRAVGAALIAETVDALRATAIAALEAGIQLTAPAR